MHPFPTHTTEPPFHSLSDGIIPTWTHPRPIHFKGDACEFSAPMPVATIVADAPSARGADRGY